MILPTVSRNSWSMPLDDVYIIAHSQYIGARPIQEDAIRQFNYECIAIADGVGAMPHGQVASTFACDTAIWGYTHVRQRPYYWEDKSKLLQRIFRTTNLALWQKRKETGFEEGIASTLSIAILGSKKVWIGAVGDGRIYLVREGLIEELVSQETQKKLHIPMALGFLRSGIQPRITSESLIAGDILIIGTDGVTDMLTEEDIRLCHEMVGNTQESVMKSVLFLIQQAQFRGGNDNMSVCIIKKK